MAKDLSRHFTIEDTGMANKHMKSCSISFCYQESTNENCHDNINAHPQNGQTFLKKRLIIPSVGEDVEQLELSSVLVGM